MRRATRLASCIVLSCLAAVAGCSYPTRNQPTAIIDETYGYRWGNLARSGLEDTLVIVTASGGGTRATALALSALRGLDRIALPNLDDPEDAFAEPSLWYDNPQRSTFGRTEHAYAQGRRAVAGAQKRYIHLLDGGIADNLGIFEPFRMLTTRDTQPSFLGEIDSGRITKLIFIVVNARSFAPSDLDEAQATPGMLDMLLASISAPIDRATAGTALQLRELLLDEFRQLALADPVNAERFQALARNTALISIDFDAIADDACRRKYQAIPTSWTLETKEVDALLEMGGALLANDPAFEDLLRITGAPPPDLPSLEEACAAL